MIVIVRPCRCRATTEEMQVTLAEYRGEGSAQHAQVCESLATLQRKVHATAQHAHTNIQQLTAKLEGVDHAKNGDMNAVAAQVKALAAGKQILFFSRRDKYNPTAAWRIACTLHIYTNVVIIDSLELFVSVSIVHCFVYVLLLTTVFFSSLFSLTSFFLIPSILFF